MSSVNSDIKESSSRAKILEAATELFGRKGYHGSTIENITRAAGISRGALYWHFESKSDVLGAVVERLQKEYLDRFIEETLQAGPKASDRLRRIFKFNARFAVEHTDLIHCLRTLSLELSPSEDVHSRAFFDIVTKQRNFLVRILTDAQQEGVIRSDIDATMLAAIILAIHDGIILQWAAFRDLWNGAELARAFRHVTLDGISRTGSFGSSAAPTPSTQPGAREASTHDIKESPMNKKIGIVGGGTMGKGLVRHFLSQGFTVTLVEATADLAAQAGIALEKVFEKAVKNGKLDAETAEKWLGNLEVGQTPAMLVDCASVIETVPEDLELKRRVLTGIEENVSAETPISTNTSALPVTALAAVLSVPERFCGTHFFNPPHVMPLVEVVRGLDTSPETVARTCDRLRSAKKKPVVVKDCPGFLVNRILGAYINEALLLLEKDAGILELDAAVEDMGLPMGPARLGDMVGWDIILASNSTLAAYYGERFAIPSLLARLKAEQRFGVKTGCGLFDYRSGPPEPTEDIVPRTRGLDGKLDAEVKERITYAIIAESIRCLDEGVANAQDIDRAMMMGAGLPKGPLSWADERGLEKVLNDLERLSRECGSRFWPAPILRIAVLAGRLGASTGRGLAATHQGDK
ncbi:MAG: 3-hydroxyacyl-CoA dehydrogenase NAD-binding domain-containing protein [Deltaproteobacteria bacterium]